MNSCRDPFSEQVSGNCPNFPTVREGGLEPPRPNGHQHLKLARLPFPPSARIRFFPVLQKHRRMTLACDRWASGTQAGVPKAALRPRDDTVDSW